MKKFNKSYLTVALSSVLVTTAFANNNFTYGSNVIQDTPIAEGESKTLLSEGYLDLKNESVEVAIGASIEFNDPQASGSHRVLDNSVRGKVYVNSGVDFETILGAEILFNSAYLDHSDALLGTSIQNKANGAVYVVGQQVHKMNDIYGAKIQDNYHGASDVYIENIARGIVHYEKDDKEISLPNTQEQTWGATIKTRLSESKNSTVKSAAEGTVYINSNRIFKDITAANTELIMTGFNGGNSTEMDQLIASAIGEVHLNNGVLEGDMRSAVADLETTLTNDISEIRAIGKIYINDGVRIANLGRIYGAVANYRELDDRDDNYLVLRARGDIAIFGNVETDATLNNQLEVWGADSLLVDQDHLDNYKLYEVFAGNTLSMGAAPITVDKIGNFEYYNFTLNMYNQSVVNDSNASLITIKDTLRNDYTVIEDDHFLNYSNIRIEKIVGNHTVKAGDSVILIDAGQIGNNNDDNSGFIMGDQLLDGSIWNEKISNIGGMFKTPVNNTVDVGLFRSANIRYEVNNDKNQIIARIDDYYINEDKAKPIAEGRLAGLTNVVRGADLLDGLFSPTRKPQGTWTPLMIMDGGKNRYNSGSHIKSDDYSFLLGTAYQATEDLSIGIAAEYGRSDYRTYNGNFHGKGHTYNYGVSVFGQYLRELESGQAYMNFSLRYGNTKTKFHSDDLLMENNEFAKYTSKAKYAGGHIGAGYIFDLNEKWNIDSSLRYLYTHLGSDSLIIDHDQVDFKSAKSSRLQLKSKFNYMVSETTQLYASITYQYEFDGKAKMNISGIGIDAPSVKGSTGILEAGFTTLPFDRSRDLSLEFNIKGYVGKQEGVRGSAILKYDL